MADVVVEVERREWTSYAAVKGVVVRIPMQAAYIAFAYRGASPAQLVLDRLQMGSILH